MCARRFSSCMITCNYTAALMVHYINTHLDKHESLLKAHTSSPQTTYSVSHLLFIFIIIYLFFIFYFRVLKKISPPHIIYVSILCLRQFSLLYYNIYQLLLHYKRRTTVIMKRNDNISLKWGCVWVRFRYANYVWKSSTIIIYCNSSISIILKTKI